MILMYLYFRGLNKVSVKNIVTTTRMRDWFHEIPEVQLNLMTSYVTFVRQNALHIVTRYRWKNWRFRRFPQALLRMAQFFVFSMSYIFSPLVRHFVTQPFRGFFLMVMFTPLAYHLCYSQHGILSVVSSMDNLLRHQWFFYEGLAMYLSRRMTMVFQWKSCNMTT